ncbi:Chromate resistance protein ChrB [Pseudarthrobacter sp. S9]|uniref:Chromate resistance protein ChrB n=1 Tax=Pseudarthrobacter sp. S9 TaxID=3418421 RepID=UPI003D00110D
MRAGPGSCQPRYLLDEFCRTYDAAHLHRMESVPTASGHRHGTRRLRVDPRCRISGIDQRRWYRELKSRNVLHLPHAEEAAVRLSRCSKTLDDYAARVYGVVLP